MGKHIHITGYRKGEVTLRHLTGFWNMLNAFCHIVYILPIALYYILMEGWDD